MFLQGLVGSLKSAWRSLGKKCIPIVFYGLCCVLAWQILRETTVQKSALNVYDRSRRAFQTIANSLNQDGEGQQLTGGGSEVPNVHQAKRHYNLASQRVLFFKPGLPLFVHRAFRDDRKDLNTIRIFGIEKRNVVSGNFTCRWTTIQKGGVEIRKEVQARRYLIDTSWPQWSQYFACNIDCRLPPKVRPRSIHLVSSEHGVDFEMLVEETYRATPRRDLAVCVKPITGKMDVSRLVEWIEIQRLAGIDNFILYVGDLSGPGRFVLEHYADLGLVTIVSFPYLSAVLKKAEPPALTPEGRYAVYQEIFLVAYHDCLYRYRGMYKFLEFTDLDEVILPAKDEPFTEMLKRLEQLRPDAASMLFLTSWHFEESRTITNDDLGSDHGGPIPDYLYMLQHVISNVPTETQTRSVVLTDRAITVNFHEVLETTGHNFTNQVIPWDRFGYLHHYRGKCKVVFSEDRCQELLADTRVDPSVMHYRDRLQTRVRDVLDHLQLTRHSLD